MSGDLLDYFSFVFTGPKEAKPVLTVDLASDIPARAFIKALADIGLTIKERNGRLLICKAVPGESRSRKPSKEAASGSH